MKRRALTIREAAAVFAVLLLAACGGGGGGTFSPFSPGVSGGSPATPAPTLAVAPASTTLALPGSTATVVATISSGAAGVTVAYTGGCANVATISPTSQVTGTGGSTPAFTETALVPSASCTARFAAAGAIAATVATVGNATSMPTPSPAPSPIPTVAPTAPPTVAPTATPVPTPPPTATPVPGPLMVSPTSAQIGNTNPTTATFVATEASYAGGFTEADTCGGIATIAQSPAGTFTATQVAGGAGPCVLTISDNHGGSVPVSITATWTGVIIFSHART